MKRTALSAVSCLLISIGFGIFTTPVAGEGDAGSTLPAPTREKAAADTKKSLKALQEDFLKLKFGMFLHFNLETYKGVQWVAGYHDPSTLGNSHRP